MDDKQSQDNNSDYSPPQKDSNAQFRSYDPDQYDRSIVINKTDKIVRLPRGINCGQWTQIENKRYIKFLQLNRKNFTSGKSRREKKIFNKMSKQIKGRNPDQCRGHHQKKIKRFGSVQQIIKFYKNRYLQNENVKQNNKEDVQQIKREEIKEQDKTGASYLIQQGKNEKQKKITFVIDSLMMFQW